MAPATAPTVRIFVYPIVNFACSSDKQWLPVRTAGSGLDLHSQANCVALRLAAGESRLAQPSLAIRIA
jgi:hypothetical protein